MNVSLSTVRSRGAIIASLAMFALFTMFAFAGTAFAAVPKSDQTITFAALSTKTYGDAYFTVSASASSGQSVSFSSTSTACHISFSNRVNIDTSGICNIKASQSGNSSYNAAPDVYRSFTINKKTLTVSGISTSNRTYNAATTATLNTSGKSLSGVVSGDSVTLNTASAVGTFSDKNVGTGKVVTISGLTISGSDASNYTLTQPTTSANITALALTATISVLGGGKVYDGTTAATLDSRNLVGVLAGDTVTISGGSPRTTTRT